MYQRVNEMGEKVWSCSMCAYYHKEGCIVFFSLLIFEILLEGKPTVRCLQVQLNGNQATKFYEIFTSTLNTKASGKVTGIDPISESQS